MTGGPALLPPPAPVDHLAIMRVAQPDYVLVLVEGDDDLATWKYWLRHSPLAQGGKTQVIAGLVALEIAGQSGYVGIVDADFFRAEHHPVPHRCCLMTQWHDLECEILSSTALDRLCEVLEISYSVGEFRKQLIKHATLFGALRWLFHKRQVCYPGGRLSPGNFFTPGWDIDQDSLLVQASAILGDPPDAIAQQEENLIGAVSDPRHLCNGHDLVAILTRALVVDRGQKRIGNKETVAKMLRLAMDSVSLQQMPIWRELQQWEQTNSYCICKDASAPAIP